MPSDLYQRPTHQHLVYGRAPANDFVAFIGPISGTVLDIGSGEGGSAGLFRLAGAARLIAIEPDPDSARVARTCYDTVLEQPIQEVTADLIGEADVIVAADCFEHLLDPWSVLRQLHAGSRPHVQLAVSVPNLRFIGILGPALLRGQFEYSDDGGVMDRGHLRWFTHASMARALASCGWQPTKWSGAVGTGKRAALDRVSRHRLSDVLAHQIYVIAAKGART